MIINTLCNLWIVTFLTFCGIFVLKITEANVIASGKISDLRINQISCREHQQEIIFTSVPYYGYS